MQRSALCRSRRELSNAYLLAKFGFDTAENEPFQVCPLSAYRSPRSLDSLLPSFPPVSPVDPALAFPAFNPAAALETDPAFVQFVQAMEQQQAIFNQALVLNMQMLQDNYMFAAALDQQLGNKA